MERPLGREDGGGVCHTACKVGLRACLRGRGAGGLLLYRRGYGGTARRAVARRRSLTLCQAGPSWVRNAPGANAILPLQGEMGTC